MATFLLRNPQVTLLKEEGGGIFYNSDTADTYAINEAGVVIWELCDGTHTKEEIEEAIKKSFGGKKQICKDTLDFLNHLIDENLLLTPPKRSGIEGEAGSGHKEASVLTHLYLYITNRCNLACRHCWITPTFTDEFVEGKVSFEEYAEFIGQAIPLGLSGVKITGGEPLLYKPLPKLVEFLNSRKIGITIETNGTLINDDLASLFHSANVFTSVSIDGAESEIHDLFRGRKGAFDMAINGLKLLLQHNVNPVVIMSLYSGNKNQIEPLLKLCSELGVKRFKINPIIEIGRGKSLGKKQLLLSREELTELLEKSEGDWQEKYGIKVLFSYPCSLKPIDFLIKGDIPICPFRNLLSVLEDGSITFCGFGYSEPKWIMGNIRETRLEHLWKEAEQLKEAREKIPDKLGGVCGRCFIKKRCQGGCRAMAMAAYGSLIAPDPTCQTFFELGQFPKSRLAPVVG